MAGKVWHSSRSRKLADQIFIHRKEAKREQEVGWGYKSFQSPPKWWASSKRLHLTCHQVLKNMRLWGHLSFNYHSTLSPFLSSPYSHYDVTTLTSQPIYCALLQSQSKSKLISLNPSKLWAKINLSFRLTPQIFSFSDRMLNNTCLVTSDTF